MELNYQYAHHKKSESESRAISKAQFAIRAFDEFDWKGETKKANALQKCAPTLSLLIDSTKHMIWVSSYGDPSQPIFVSECHFPGEVTRFLGFGKKNGIVNLHTGSFSKNQARTAISLFVEGDHKKLTELYKHA